VDWRHASLVRRADARRHRDRHDGALVIDDNAGCTVWLREKLTAPVVITYEAPSSLAAAPTTACPT